MKTENCSICGAWYGIHESGTNKCPVNGIENFKYQETTFQPLILPKMNEKELIKYLLGELDKISKIEPEKAIGLDKSITNLISAVFSAKITALKAIQEAEKHFKN